LRLLLAGLRNTTSDQLNLHLLKFDKADKLLLKTSHPHKIHDLHLNWNNFLGLVRPEWDFLHQKIRLLNWIVFVQSRRLSLNQFFKCFPFP
jgi:hypothetical protein